MKTARRCGTALTTLAIGIGWALAGPAPAANAPVSLVNVSFAPATVTVNVGDTVTWTNNETSQIPHSVTSDTAGQFDSSPSCSGADTATCLLPGQTFSQTFSTAGTFTYHCRIHANMHGTIVVVAAAPASPAPRPSPTASPAPAASPTVASSPTASSPSSSASPAAANSAGTTGGSSGSTAGSSGGTTQALGTQQTKTPTLPFTGAHNVLPLSLLAAVLLALGSAVLIVSRRRAARH
ncbi:MAG: cupredoxin domain-containing protein [Actinomycetota bacterium]